MKRSKRRSRVMSASCVRKDSGLPGPGTKDCSTRARLTITHKRTPIIARPDQTLILLARSAATPRTREHRVYGATTCGDGHLRANCTKAAQGRRIKRYPEDEQREALRLVMQHPQARRIFSQRKAIVEPVFSSLRSQQGLNRFRRRGLQAVKREFALHVLAHNLSRAVALLAALFAFLYAVWRRLGDAVNNFPERARQSVGLRHHSYPRPDFMR